MRRTNIYLEDEQTVALDALAAAEGVSRAEVIRRILDRALAGDGDALVADRAALDLSFGSLAGVAVEVPARGPDERAEHLAAVWGADA